jgi:hypothetical protein
VYTAAAFWTGLLRTSTDNWGHAGGLVCGAVCGLVFEPRLLRLSQVEERRAVALVPWLLVVTLVVAVVAVGGVVPRLSAGFVPLRFPAFGVVLEHPRTWTRSPNPLGFVAVGNGTDVLASLACSRSSGDQPPPHLDDVTRRFIDGELFGLSRQGHIARLEVDAADDVVIAATPARRVGFTFVASDGPFNADARVFVRGAIECVLVTAWRTDASPAARALLAGIVERLQVVPTDAETSAIARTTQQAGSTRAWLERARAHADAGAVAAARAAFEKATALAEEEPSWIARVGLERARFELQQGEAANLDVAANAATRAARRTAEAPRAGDAQAAELAADVAAVVVDVAFARRQTELGCIELLGARARFPKDARFASTRGCAP